MTVLLLLPLFILLFLIIGSGAVGLVLIIFFNLATAGGIYYGSSLQFVPHEELVNP